MERCSMEDPAFLPEAAFVFARQTTEKLKAMSEEVIISIKC